MMLSPKVEHVYFLGFLEDFFWLFETYWESAKLPMKLVKAESAMAVILGAACCLCAEVTCSDRSSEQ